jgi:Secretion system C-terminal sorting domain
MKRIFTIIVLGLLFSSSLVKAQIYSTDFGTATSGTPPSPFITSTILEANLQNNGWTGGTTFFTGVAGGAYSIGTNNGNGTYTLSLKPLNAKAFSITTLDFSMRRTSTGPTNISVSVNGVAFVVTGAPGNGSFAAISASGSATNITSPFTVIITTAGGTGTGQNVRLDNFSIGGTVLSVDLNNFVVSNNSNTTKLSWQTTSEKNNAYFNIERSQNGETFTKIGQVKGNGTSSVAQNYSFTDATPYKGINYYRLRQVDFDGTESVSTTVSVNLDGTAKNKFKVYPTLVQDNLTVELNGEGKSEITVRDLTGRAILTQNTEGPSTQVLNLGGFSNGLYLLSVRSNDGFETVKIQKN